MNIIVGAPVYRREWIIGQWFEHVYDSLDFAGIKDRSFAFAGDLRDPTFEYINEYGLTEKVYVKRFSEPSVTVDYKRQWNHEAYHKMVILRNRLLDIPRQLEPTFFLSVDTDILLHKECVANLIESADIYDAVAGKAYMTKNGKHYPSYGMLTKDGNLRRTETTGVIKVDVIMALKLMSPNAYNTDYTFHKQGEDIGWSLNVRKQGMILGFDGRVPNKHILQPSMLDKVDPRCGF